MRRVDILKKVIVGGKTRARIGAAGDPYDLMGQKAFTGHDGYQKEVPDDVLCTVSPLGGGMPMAGCLSTSSTTFTFNNNLVTFGEIVMVGQCILIPSLKVQISPAKTLLTVRAIMVVKGWSQNHLSSAGL